MIRLSASMLERVEQCPASVALPQSPHTGDDAMRGTSAHAAAETTTPEQHAALLDGLTEVEHESSYVLDVAHRSARRTGHRRDYGELPAGSVGVTLDVEGSVDTGRWRVIDWKSRKRVTSAARNLQLACQALAVFAVHSATEVEVVLAYLDNGEHDRHTWTLFDAPALWDRLDVVVAHAATARPDDVHSGGWCDYCPALVHCPRQRALVATFGIPDSLDHLTPEVVGEFYTKIGPLEKLLDQAKKLVSAYAAHTPVPLPGGRELGLVECHRASIDGKAALARLSEHGIQTADLTRETTYTQLRTHNRKGS